MGMRSKFSVLSCRRGGGVGVESVVERRGVGVVASARRRWQYHCIPGQDAVAASRDDFQAMESRNIDAGAAGAPKRSGH